MNSQARAILWAQWRSLLNYFPKSNKSGLVFPALAAIAWYGMWSCLAVLAVRFFSDPGNHTLAVEILPGALLFITVYWQVVPVFLGTSGVSLSTRKLVVYPIPGSQMFFIELLLRISTTVEMILLLVGIAIGLLANPRLPAWSAAGLIPFVVFNLCVSAGVREIMMRVFARKRVREIAVLALMLAGAIPQVLITTGAGQRLGTLFQGVPWPAWPWSAAATIASRNVSGVSVAALLAWTAAAYWFGRWQFERTLRSDADESNATPAGKPGRDPLLARWPRLLFHDPLAALVEKEIRFLSRAPRFRLVFVMGFTFGLVIWLPVAFGRNSFSGVFGRNYLTFICVYALLLLGEVCFWNTFGFDRTAAQAYWAMPVRFSTVLQGKNVSALFFVLLETTCIILLCAILRMPVRPATVAEAYAVTLVISAYLIALGNLTSTASARGLNPARSMRTGSPGRVQAWLLLLYPVAALPVLLAYGARYAFKSEAALFIVLGIMAGIGLAVYWVSLESAVAAAERNKERLLAALSQGEGVMQ